MKLIEKLKTVTHWPNGLIKPLGLFLCPFCGAQVERPLYAGLRFKSCGCQQTPHGERNPKYRHGASSEPIYQVWAAMLARCQNVANKSYPDYGGKVYAPWKTAAVFIEWAKTNGYRRGLMLDRRDNDRGYTPDNCRWVTPTQSARNKRNMKLSISMAALIRDAVRSGVSYPELATRFHVSSKLIGQVARGKAWKVDP